jgi:3-deoxy-D-manno-octulosonic-acid transferase
LDTVGELRQFYAVADAAFVGGSLVNVGGHNLLEPARLKKPVLFGPFVDNFKPLAAELKRSGGGIQVQTAEQLRGELVRLLTDAHARETAGERAYEVAAADSGVLERNLALAEKYLEAESRRPAA